MANWFTRLFRRGETPAPAPAEEPRRAPESGSAEPLRQEPEQKRGLLSRLNPFAGRRERKERELAERERQVQERERQLAERERRAQVAEDFRKALEADREMQRRQREEMDRRRRESDERARARAEQERVRREQDQRAGDILRKYKPIQGIGPKGSLGAIYTDRGGAEIMRRIDEAADRQHRVSLRLLKHDESWRDLFKERGRREGRGIQAEHLRNVIERGGGDLETWIEGGCDGIEGDYEDDLLEGVVGFQLVEFY